jgi:hypothetical protein
MSAAAGRSSGKSRLPVVLHNAIEVSIGRVMVSYQTANVGKPHLDGNASGSGERHRNICPKSSSNLLTASICGLPIGKGFDAILRRYGFL